MGGRAPQPRGGDVGAAGPASVALSEFTAGQVQGIPGTATFPK